MCGCLCTKRSWWLAPDPHVTNGFASEVLAPAFWKRSARKERGPTVKTAFVCDVVYEQDAHGSAVVRCSYRPEAFLTGRVPDLQLDPLAIKLNSTDFKVDANGGDE